MPVTMNDGRLGSFGIAKQTVGGTYVPPTSFLRETGGSGFVPDYAESTDQFFAGSRFAAPAQHQGTDYQGRTVTGEGALPELVLLSELMFGDQDGTGTITPAAATQFSNYFVGTPFSAQWYVPTAGYVQIRDGQFYELAVTVPEGRENVTFSASFHAAWAKHFKPSAAKWVADDISELTPTAVVTPDYLQAFGRLHLVFTLDGVVTPIDGASTLTLRNPIDALPANGEYIPGFAPGTDPVGCEITGDTNGTNLTILAASNSKAFLPFSWKLSRTVGNVTTSYEVKGQAQVTAREVPLAAGRVKASWTLMARSQTPGQAPFQIVVTD